MRKPSKLNSQGMRYLTFIWSFIILIAVNAFGAEFEKLSLQEALNKASQENKYVFFYMTAKWCGPCLKMQKEVFPNDTISQILKDHFVAIKYDYDSWAGEQLRKEYDIVALPTILIFNSEGKVVKRNARFLNSSQLLNFITVNKQESASSNTLSEYEQKLKEYMDTRQKPFKPEVGIRLGINHSQIVNIENDGKTGFEAVVFVSIESSRVLIRPGIGFVSKGNSLYPLNYLSVPIDFGFSVYKGAFFGLPGGCRIIGAPNYSFLLNDTQQLFKRNDFGVRYGIAAYIGDTSKIELILTSDMGLLNISELVEETKRNQSYSFGVAFTF